MADAARHIDQIRDLAVSPVPMRVDNQFDVEIGKSVNQPTNDGNSRVRWILDPEHNLHGPWIILEAERDEIVLKSRFGAMQWLEQGDRGIGPPWGLGPRRQASREPSDYQSVKAPEGCREKAQKR